MRYNKQLILTGVIISSLLVKANAEVTLPKVIANNMVLQRNKAVPIWGNAAAGEAVTVTFHNQSKKTQADASGHWQVSLDAMPASATPSNMVIAGSNTIHLQNILVGEVWLCSGQSNMEYSMRKNSKVTVPPGVTDWPVNEIDSAHNPAIRIFLVDRKKMNPDPKHEGWSVAEDSALRSFSAAGYFFAKKLYNELHVPIGMISSAIPGSRIEPWASRDAFEASPYFKNKADTTRKIEGDPGKFYDVMIKPLAPFALKGFLWYQGETNCFLAETLQYTYKMQALIKEWRSIWLDQTLPFYYVQIAPFEYSKSKDPKVVLTPETLPQFWEAQTLALQIPHTGEIVTTDLNDKPGELHPHFKWEIGRRLALWALANDYGRKDIVPSGPLYQQMKITGNKIELSFTYTGNGLTSADGKPLQCFTIAGADGKFVPAEAVITNNKVLVSAPAITAPKAVRFSWNETDKSNFYNKNGLPAVPFRTDNPLTGKLQNQ